MANILLVSYNHSAFIHYFPLALAYVAAALRRAGHFVEVYPQDVHHSPDEHLTRYLDKFHLTPFNVVGVGMCAGYVQYDKMKRIAGAVRMAKTHHDLILGGHMVSADAKYFQEKMGASKVFVGEVETELQQVTDWSKKEVIQGTAYDPDLSLPAWDLFDMGYYSLVRLPHAENSDRCFPVLSGRGCPFKCSFCYRVHEGYRPRKIDSIVEEIRMLQKSYGITYVDFADELLMATEQRTIDMCKALKPLNVKWMCNGRLNFAKPLVLREMEQSGCQFINYGIESVDDNVLRKMQKALNYKQIVAGVEATLQEGISPGLNMLWGNIGDTLKTLWDSVRFLETYSDHAQMRTIRPVTPYPGTPLFDDAVKLGLVKNIEDFYEHKHKATELLTCNFMDMSKHDAHQALFNANMSLIQNHAQDFVDSWRHKAKKLYFENDTNFKGFRPL